MTDTRTTDAGDALLALLTTPSLEARLRPLDPEHVEALSRSVTENPELVRPRSRARRHALRVTTPARPERLKFCTDKRRRHVFPKRKELRLAEGRARAMHFFANHELLAIEALVRGLLLFPELSSEARRDALETLADEQRHLSLYLDRMAELGLEFGALPVNDYIWCRALDATTPASFLAFFALTLEGANLDHARLYMQLFDQLEDPISARVMRDVLADEIIHVRRGWTAFRELPEHGGEAGFEEFAGALIWPLTPGRAKGPSWFPDTRRAAGLPDEMIRRIGQASRRTDGPRPGDPGFRGRCPVRRPSECGREPLGES